jgi:hypothetical protein
VSMRSMQLGEPGEHWNPSRHTVPVPTDAYGCIDFRGGTQTNKAQVSGFCLRPTAKLSPKA